MVEEWCYLGVQLWPNAICTRLVLLHEVLHVMTKVGMGVGRRGGDLSQFLPLDLGGEGT